MSLFVYLSGCWVLRHVFMQNSTAAAAYSLQHIRLLAVIHCLILKTHLWLYIRDADEVQLDLMAAPEAMRMKAAISCRGSWQRDVTID